MQVETSSSWQWTLRASITAADACRVCSALALEYTDCSLIRVRRHAFDRCIDTKADEQQQQQPEHNNDNDDLRDDIELAGHCERVASLAVFRESTRECITLCSASSDWCESLEGFDAHDT